MKKKLLAVILPTFFGPFGLLYSSTFAGSIMIFIGLLIGLILALQENLHLIILFSIILQPFILFWSTLLINEKEENGKLENDKELQIGGEAIIYSFITLFITLFLTAIITFLYPQNILQNNANSFYIIILIISIILSLTVITKQKTSK